MHPMKLTNKQIQELVGSMRKQLKQLKTTGGKLNIVCELPEIEREKATVVIAQHAWAKLVALVDECSKEIAWHGTVVKENNTYTITDILVFPQTVTGATVTSDETEYSMWLMNKPDEVFNSIRFHGHSHVNMGVSPSGVDTDYQDNIIKNLQDFYIFMIFNKKGDYWCAIYDVESNVVYNNDDIELVTPNTGAKEWAKEEIKRLVKEPTKPKATKKKESETPITDRIMNDCSDDEYGYGYGYGGWWNNRYGQK